MKPLQPDISKRNAGYRAAEMVKDGMVLGLGTGSTVWYAMEALSNRIREEELDVVGIPTSYQAAIRARDFGIPFAGLDEHPVPDLAIDGADQVDHAFRLIKGRGAALVREKIVAAAAKGLVIVGDSSKIVERLNAAVPVEVLPFGSTPVARTVRAIGGVPTLREGKEKDGPVITDNGNFILDCRFGEISEPELLETRLTGIPGVLECGLFCGYSSKTTLIVGNLEGSRVLLG